MIGMQAQIGSQMTQDEAIDYINKVLAIAERREGGHYAGEENPNLVSQLRYQLIGIVVSTIGRPIAAAEIAAIAKAEQQFDEMRRDGAIPIQASTPGRSLAPDSPFGKPL